MKILFCDSVFDNKQVEPEYEEEFHIAKTIGFDVSVLSFEELNSNNVRNALKYIRKSDELELGIYRGWMMTPEVYANLYKELLERNIKLINNPKEYEHCHYLPSSYNKIKERTPKSNWSESVKESDIINLSNAFGSIPIIVKDFVKSEKHNWSEACFIPNASDKEQVLKVVNRFLELRGDYLNKGLVFREFVELEFLTEHSKSKMPLTKEFRIVFCNQEILQIFNYWDEGDYKSEKPDIEFFQKCARDIESNFFTMDIAKTKAGDWIIMELGDGQVAGLPDNANKMDYYKALQLNAKLVCL